MKAKDSSDYFTNPVHTNMVEDVRKEIEFEEMNGKERRFRGKVGWAPLTDYIAIRFDGGYVVHKNDPNLFGADGSEVKIDAYTLEYCLFQIECGNWMEL
jgi:hypothetical protein